VKELPETKLEAERQREALRLVRQLLQEASNLGVTGEDLDLAWEQETKERA
jgi:hypothetical protein